MAYFNFELNPEMATSLIHTLNRRYKGARRFSAMAPDAQGTLIIWARDQQECQEHLLNALFDLIFARNRVGAAVSNPPCIFCGGKTQSRGRNSSGTRAWRCMNPDCQRSFVIDRSFRGGINHPTQSKKPDFCRLVFVDGKTIREACGRPAGRDRWCSGAAEEAHRERPPAQGCESRAEISSLLHKPVPTAFATAGGATSGGNRREASSEIHLSSARAKFRPDPDLIN